MSRLEDARSKVEGGERLTREDGVALLRDGDFLELGALADLVRWRKHPEPVVTYIIDRNINYTNVCTAQCAFCAFYRDLPSKEGYLLSKRELAEKIEETIALGGRQILVLVDPRQFPDSRATDTAMGAADVLKAARVCATLDEALVGTTLAVALSARQRDLSPLVLDAREAAQLAVAEAVTGGEVAFVFGTEVSGLPNDEVIRCQRVARIATDAGFSSLNLAAAVQVVAYEIRYAALGASPQPAPRTPAATHEELEGLFAHLATNLESVGFFDPANPRRLLERLRRILGRACLDSQEVNVLRGVLAAWDAALRGGRQDAGRDGRDP